MSATPTTGSRAYGLRFDFSRLEVVVSVFTKWDNPLTEVVYFEVVAEDDLSLAAKRLSIPLWGRLLLGLLCVLFTSIGVAFWNGLNRLNSADTTMKGIKDSIQVLADKTPDKDLINRLLSESRKAEDDALAAKLQPVEKKLKDIEASNKAVTDKQQALKKQVDGQQALIRIGSPLRILAIIQEEIRLAETSLRLQSAAQLADYKSALLAIPDSQPGYWDTVAAVVNYQSFLNQLNGSAPDPERVARICPGVTTQGTITSMNNFIGAVVFAKCVVDLDSNTFAGTTFQDAVVRYHGGPTSLQNVKFINCRFILTMRQDQHAPAKPRLLLSILESDQKSVSLSTE